jgi:hypothetical protein
MGQPDDIEKKADKAIADATVEVRENDKWVKAPAGYFEKLDRIQAMPI